MTRDELLEKLVEAKVITLGQSRDIRSRTSADAEQGEILGLIKGSYSNVKPRSVTNATGISIVDWDAARPRDVATVWTPAERAADKAQTQALLDAGKDKDRAVPTSSWAGTPFKTGNEAITFIIEEYDKLKAEGAFSLDEQKQIEKQLNTQRKSNPGPSVIDGIIRDIELATDDPSDMAGIKAKVPTSYNFELGEDEAKFLEGQPEYGGLASLSPAQQATRTVDSDTMSSAETSFLASLQRDGVIPEGVSLTTRERSSYTGSGTVYDRATGEVLSEDEWNLIKTSSEAARIYRERASVSESVKTLLASGKFTNTPSKYQTRYVTTGSRPTGREDVREVRSRTSKNLIPIEDLAVPSAAGVNEPWQADTWDYRVGDGRAEWVGMSPIQRNMRLKLMADNGLISPEEMDAMNYAGMEGGNPLNFTAMEIWEQATSVSSEFQYSPLDAIRAIGEQKAVSLAASRGRGGGGGGRRPTYSVPASLREIPDYKTLAQDTKSIFAGQLGREMEDWELKLYAEELGSQYSEANERRIQISKEAWDDAVSGGSLSVDFTAVEDPSKSLEYDIGETYANEIDRNVRVEDKANQRRLLMQSISVGQRMI